MTDRRSTQPQRVTGTNVDIPPEGIPEGEPEKKPKKKKLTKAEKKALKLQREIEFRKASIRDHLKRELELSRHVAKKAKTEWEEMCKEIKMIEMRQELQVWEAKTRHVLQEKDVKIETLLNFLDDFEQMQQRLFAGQTQLISYVMNIYEGLLENHKSLFQNEATSLIEEFQRMLHDQRTFQEQSILNCEKVMHTTNMVTEDAMLRDFEMYRDQRDDIVETDILKRHHIRDKVVAKMQDIQKNLVDFVNSLKSSSIDVHKYDNIRMLMKRQRAFVVESAKLNEEETKCTQLYGELQRELLQLEMESQRRINDLRLEHGYFSHVRKLIEAKMEADRLTTFEKLKTMTSETYNTVKQLQTYRDRGELLLALSASIRKLQTEAEKVVMLGKFPTSKDYDAEDAKLMRIFFTRFDTKLHLDLAEEDLCDRLNTTANFQRRRALVRAQNALLEQEKASLLQERQKYTDLIKSLGNNIKDQQADDAWMASLAIEHVIPNEICCPHN